VTFGNTAGLKSAHQKNDLPAPQFERNGCERSGTNRAAARWGMRRLAAVRASGKAGQSRSSSVSMEASCSLNAHRYSAPAFLMSPRSSSQFMSPHNRNGLQRRC
jgi:hypothetical protein